MINSDLNNFFKHAHNLTSFERKKKVYDLTNDLDSDLLDDLIIEANLFYINKIHKRIRKNKKLINRLSFENKDASMFMNKYVSPIQHTTVEKILSNGDKVSKFSHSLNDWADYVLDNYEIDFIGDVMEESAEFLNDLDGLKIRGSKLLKNIEASKNNKSEEVIDYSDTAITSKIIFLVKLGIVEFLRKEQPFNTSINSLATVFSALTGGKVITIQPMLNAMLSEGVDDKKNPMKSKKTVDVVVNKLVQIGFNPRKSQ